MRVGPPPCTNILAPPILAHLANCLQYKCNNFPFRLRHCTAPSGTNVIYRSCESRKGSRRFQRCVFSFAPAGRDDPWSKQALQWALSLCPFPHIVSGNSSIANARSPRKMNMPIHRHPTRRVLAPLHISPQIQSIHAATHQTLCASLPWPAYPLRKTCHLTYIPISHISHYPRIILRRKAKPGRARCRRLPVDRRPTWIRTHQRDDELVMYQRERATPRA